MVVGGAYAIYETAETPNLPPKSHTDSSRLASVRRERSTPPWFLMGLWRMSFHHFCDASAGEELMPRKHDPVPLGCWRQSLWQAVGRELRARKGMPWVRSTPLARQSTVLYIRLQSPVSAVTFPHNPSSTTVRKPSFVSSAHPSLQQPYTALPTLWTAPINVRALVRVLDLQRVKAGHTACHPPIHKPRQGVARAPRTHEHSMTPL